MQPVFGRSWSAAQGEDAAPMGWSGLVWLLGQKVISSATDFLLDIRHFLCK